MSNQHRCPDCRAIVYPARQFGRVYLNDHGPHGPSHVCAHKLPGLLAKQQEAAAAGKALESTRRYSDTTGNRIPRWSYKPGACVEPY